MTSFLAVAGCDGGPGGAAAGVVDGVNDRLSPGQGHLQLDAGDCLTIELCDRPETRITLL